MHRSALTCFLAGLFASSFIASASAQNGYISWCVDYDVMVIRQISMRYSDGSCSVALYMPYEGSQNAPPRLMSSGSDVSECWSSARKIIKEMDGFNCGGWSWLLDEAAPSKSLIDNSLLVIRDYVEKINEWNWQAKNYTEISLRDVTPIFPHYRSDEWNYELDSSGVWLMVSVGKYSDGYNWPTFFLASIRADGIGPWSEPDPTEGDDRLIQLGLVENGACHGSDSWQLMYVDMEGKILVGLLSGYSTCDGLYNRHVLAQRAYVLNDEGEGIWSLVESPEK